MKAERMIKKESINSTIMTIPKWDWLHAWEQQEWLEESTNSTIMTTPVSLWYWSTCMRTTWVTRREHK